jgi:hypothetical protein
VTKEWKKRSWRKKNSNTIYSIISLIKGIIRQLIYPLFFYGLQPGAIRGRGNHKYDGIINCLSLLVVPKQNQEDFFNCLLRQI